MKFAGVTIAALATLAQCSLIDLEGLFEGRIDSLKGFLGEAANEQEPKVGAAQAAAADLMSEVSGIVGSALGSAPAAAADAWAAVLEQVPNGAKKLAEGMKLEAQRRGVAFANEKIRPKIPFKSGTSHKSAEKAKDPQWEYHVTDERLPQHALRIKSPKDLGIDKVKQYSGYLDVEDEDKHFFFWFFESRSDPKNDPVVLWLNGGPGCSSLTGLFFELGPASIGEDLKPVPNKYSWNSNANIIFLDQPVNVGYSYSSGQVTNTRAAGQDTYAFLELFFTQFPEYADRDFHIAGESYAGHYIPAFASEIASHSDRSFNMTSVLIGNGLTDPLVQMDYYQPMACGQGGHEAVLDDEACQKMLDSQPRCRQLVEGCYQSESAWVCVPAAVYCNNVNLGPYTETGLNVYDIREPCAGDNGLCYPQLDFVDQYLNLPEVKEAVGAGEVDKYQGCNMEVNQAFLFNGDYPKPFQQDVSLLLSLDIPVLIYAGDKDYICNWLGNEAWPRELGWDGHDEFAEKKLKPWVTKSGEKAGEVRNVDLFTFLRVYEAGHMVPYNQPKNALEMLNRWTSGDFTYR